MCKKEIPETAGHHPRARKRPLQALEGTYGPTDTWVWSLVLVMRQFMSVVLSCPTCWLQQPLGKLIRLAFPNV